MECVPSSTEYFENAANKTEANDIENETRLGHGLLRSVLSKRGSSRHMKLRSRGQPNIMQINVGVLWTQAISARSLRSAPRKVLLQLPSQSLVRMLRRSTTAMLRRRACRTPSWVQAAVAVLAPHAGAVVIHAVLVVVLAVVVTLVLLARPDLPLLFCPLPP